MHIDIIKSQTKEEQLQNASLKYNLFLDFDTCEPYQGTFNAQRRVDINKFGKTVDKEINEFEINNTQAKNKVKFKLYRDGSRQSERLRKFGIGLEAAEGDTYKDEKEDVGLLAMAEFNICDIRNFWVNRPLSLAVPLQ